MLLVLGTGQRCGSTLMQRLLSSHPHAFIWGEHGGDLEAMLTAVEGVAAYSASIAGVMGRKDWSENGHQAFIANLMPEPQRINVAFRGFVEEVFRSPPQAAGKRVWGYKEVRHDLDFAKRLNKFLPDLKVILVVRDLRDILCSVDEWARRGRWSNYAAEELVRRWHRITRSCLGSDVSSGMPVLIQRFEDYTKDPKQTAETVGDFTGLDPDLFDLSVFERRLHAHTFADGEAKRPLRSWPELPIEWRSLLDDDRLRKVAAEYGYSFTD